jgi:hypothetical protein
MKIDILNPCWVTGFVDGEGCFSISFTKRTKSKFGLEVRPSFSISQHHSNFVILEKLHDFFDCGGIRYSKRDRTYKYEVRNLDNLVLRILPHFQLYPLQTSKKEDFHSFFFICLKLKQNLHKQQAELIDIVEIAYSMNLSGTRKYRKEDLLKLIIS